jgi:hypothetical protein
LAMLFGLSRLSILSMLDGPPRDPPQPGPSPELIDDKKAFPL